jgi:hypothetical protein
MIKSTIANNSHSFIDNLFSFSAECCAVCDVNVSLFSFFGAIYDISVEKVRFEWIAATWVDVAVALVAEGAGGV